MNIQKKLLVMFFCVLAIGLSGCSTTPKAEPIAELPEGAKKIATVDMTGRDGTFTAGSFNAWNDGYMVLDIHLQSGRINTLEIVNGTTGEVVDSLKKPKRAIYDTVEHTYRSGREYNLSFINSENLTGTIDVYFVTEFPQY